MGKRLDLILALDELLVSFDLDLTLAKAFLKGFWIAFLLFFFLFSSFFSVSASLSTRT